MAEILRGAAPAEAMSQNIKERVRALLNKSVQPCLAIVRVGEKIDAVSYERSASARCEKLGIAVSYFTLSDGVEEKELLELIDKINQDRSIHGCLILKPLPKHINPARVCEALSPAKDVDSTTRESESMLYSGKGDGFYPCTAQACMELLNFYGCELEGKNVAVIGRSLVVGRAVSIMLQDKNATVTMCHSKTRNMAEICRDKDIIVAAAGSAGLVNKDFANPNQIIIDVGINADANGMLTGDVCYEEVAPLVKAITPVPGGVGSLTTMVLAKHVVEAAERQSI